MFHNKIKERLCLICKELQKREGAGADEIEDRQLCPKQPPTRNIKRRLPRRKSAIDKALFPLTTIGPNPHERDSPEARIYQHPRSPIRTEHGDSSAIGKENTNAKSSRRYRIITSQNESLSTIRSIDIPLVPCPSPSWANVPQHTPDKNISESLHTPEMVSCAMPKGAHAKKLFTSNGGCNNHDTALLEATSALKQQTKSYYRRSPVKSSRTPPRRVKTDRNVQALSLMSMLSDESEDELAKPSMTSTSHTVKRNSCRKAVLGPHRPQKCSLSSPVCERKFCLRCSLDDDDELAALCPNEKMPARAR
jgi:hypothetical protein